LAACRDGGAIWHRTGDGGGLDPVIASSPSAPMEGQALASSLRVARISVHSHSLVSDGSAQTSGLEGSIDMSLEITFPQDTINATITLHTAAQTTSPTGMVTESDQVSASVMAAEFNAVTPSMQSAAFQITEQSQTLGPSTDIQDLSFNIAEVTPLNFSLDLSHLWHY
jgi:hypothetical protein